MVELSWSQTPSSVWWALETGTAGSNLSLDNILSPPTPNKAPGKRTLQHQLTSPTIFYNSLDETDFGEREEDLEQWVGEDPSRGIIRSVNQHACMAVDSFKASTDIVLLQCQSRSNIKFIGLLHVALSRFRHPYEL